MTCNTLAFSWLLRPHQQSNNVNTSKSQGQGQPGPGRLLWGCCLRDSKGTVPGSPRLGRPPLAAPHAAAGALCGGDLALPGLGRSGRRPAAADGTRDGAEGRHRRIGGTEGGDGDWWWTTGFFVDGFWMELMINVAWWLKDFSIIGILSRSFKSGADRNMSKLSKLLGRQIGSNVVSRCYSAWMLGCKSFKLH